MARSCRPASFGKRVRSSLSNPSRFLVLALGLGLFAIGVLQNSQTAGTTLLVFGTLVVILGAVLPSIVEIDLGVDHLSFRRVIPQPVAVMEMRQRDLETYSQMNGTAVQRFALLLTDGDERAATELVGESLISAFTTSDSNSMERRDRQVMCVLVRRFLGMAALGLAPTADPEPRAGPGEDPRSEADPVAAVLSSLPPRTRAIVLLTHYRDMEKADVAGMIGCSRDDVEAGLRSLEDAIRDAQLIRAGGST